MGLGRIHLFGPSCGGMYVEVETDNTTQESSKCGRMHSRPLTLKDRIYLCQCGHAKEGMSTPQEAFSAGHCRQYRGALRNYRAWIELPPLPGREGEESTEA